MPVRWEDYGPGWDQFAAGILERDGQRCVDCGASGVTLAASHNCHDPGCRDEGHVWTRCNRCHLAFDREHHAESRKQTAAAKNAWEIWDETAFL